MKKKGKDEFSLDDFNLPREVPSTDISPDVGASSPPSRLSNVVLPEPEGPTIAANSPSSKLRSIPLTALTSTSVSL